MAVDDGGDRIVASEEKHRAHGPRLLWISEPSVEYSYTVNGQTYKGDRIWLYHSVSAESIQVGDQEFTAADVVARYSVGAPVEIYFNASDPAEAVLERHIGATSTTLLALSAVVVVVGLVLVLVSVLRRSTRPATSS